MCRSIAYTSMVLGVLLMVGGLVWTISPEAVALPPNGTGGLGYCLDDGGKNAWCNASGVGYTGCANKTGCEPKADGEIICYANDPWTCPDGTCGAEGVTCPARKFNQSAAIGDCTDEIEGPGCITCGCPTKGAAWYCCSTGNMWTLNSNGQCSVKKCAILMWVSTTRCIPS